MTKKIAVIDGNSLMHRAYHAVPPTMNAPDGTPTNAVFGFLTMLCKFIEMASPDAVVCAFDAGKPVHRIEAMAQYKAQRPPMDEELHVQFPVIQELLESMAIPVVKVPGWEGDDILGTIAARDEALGYETLLVTGDKDAYQLASELTRIVTTKKGITDVTINGPAEVEERYGVTPAQFIDYLGPPRSFCRPTGRWRASTSTWGSSRASRRRTSRTTARWRFCPERSRPS